MSDHDQVRMDLGGYVLGGLEDHEVDAVEAHLAGCAACRDELTQLEPLPALLGRASTEPVAAPADLRQRVLDDRAARRRHRVLLPLAAAAAAVIAVLGVAVVSAIDGRPAADAIVALRSDGPVDITGDAELRQVAAGVQVDLTLDGVRPAEDGYYHAWLEGDGWRASAGTFVGPPDGELRAQLLCGGDLQDYDRLTITWHGADGAETVAVAATLATGVPGAGGPEDGQG